MIAIARFRKLSTLVAVLGVVGWTPVAAAQLRPGAVVEAAPMPASALAPSATLRAAVRALDTTYTPAAIDGPGAPALLRALALVRRGRMDDAREALLPLAAGTDSAGALARSVLGQVMLNRGEWAALAAGAGSDGAGPLFAAYARAAPETFEFDADSAVLPLTLTPVGTPMVEVTVNGKPHLLWVDTGAGLTVLSSALAAEVGLEVDGEAGSAGTGTSQRVATRGAVIDELRVGNAIARNHPVLVIDAASLEVRAAADQPALKIDGIIGWPFLKALDMTLDYAGGRMIVRRPVARAGVKRNLMWMGYPTWIARAPNGRELRFGIDTGANGSHVAPAFLEAAGVLATGTRTRQVGGAGGFEQITVATLDSTIFHVDGGWRVILGSADVHPVRLADEMDLHGVVGSDLFRSGAVRIDWTNGRVELMPAAP